MPGLGTDTLEEGQHAGALRVEGAPESDCQQDQCPWVCRRRPSALLGDRSTLARRSGSASCQSTAFSLGPSACESVCPPVTSETGLHLSFGTPEARPAGLQSRTLGGPCSWYRAPGQGARRGPVTLTHVVELL